MTLNYQRVSSSKGLTLLETALLLGTLALVALTAIPMVGVASGENFCNTKPDNLEIDPNNPYETRYYYKRISLGEYRCCLHNGETDQACNSTPDPESGQLHPDGGDGDGIPETLPESDFEVPGGTAKVV